MDRETEQQLIEAFISAGKHDIIPPTERAKKDVYNLPLKEYKELKKAIYRANHPWNKSYDMAKIKKKGKK